MAGPKTRIVMRGSFVLQKKIMFKDVTGNFWNYVADFGFEIAIRHLIDHNVCISGEIIDNDGLAAVAIDNIRYIPRDDVACEHMRVYTSYE